MSLRDHLKDEEMKAELRQVILPILSEDEAGGIEVVGTGFVILANKRQAHFVTAGHVGSHIQRQDRPRPRAHLSTPSDFRAPEFRTELRRVQPFVIFCHPTRGHIRVPIEAWLDLKNADLALCSIRFEDNVPSDVVFEKSLKLDSRPVTAGEPVSALGYTEGRARAIDVDKGLWRFEGMWRKVSGVVTDPMPELKIPGMTAACFECDVGFDHGMSGGPVCSGGEGGEIVVRGVVSSEHTASMIWQILLMPVRLPTPDGNISGRTLLVLESEGILVDRGRGSDHLLVHRGNDGQVLSANWVNYLEQF